MTLLNDVTKMT